MSEDAELQLPTYPQLVRTLSRIAQEKSEWAGLPIPQIDNYRLRLEPRFPYQFRECSNHDVDADLDHTPLVDVINSWWSDVKMANVIVYETPDGKRHYQLEHFNKGATLLGTMMVSVAWTLDAEIKAMEKLGTLIEDHKMSAYMITGGFIETSKRSGVTYFFRRLRPTLAIKESEGELKILCALCLHCVGYYQGTWGGAMTPTDEVVAHLCMMRGSEEKFWANANQHHAINPQSGL
jgi:hypothetical protein